MAAPHLSCASRPVTASGTEPKFAGLGPVGPLYMVSARTSAYLWRGIPSRCGQRSGSAARGHARRPCAMQRQLPAKGAKTPAYGAFLMSGSPHVAELMACMGFDFLVVDMEHSPIGFETATAMLQAARAGGARTVLLRVECDRAEVLKRALDIGPDGIIVPLISTPEAAAGVIAACRYPHDGGVRGVAYPLVRASRWGTDPDYLHPYKDRVMILPQVRTWVRPIALRRRDVSQQPCCPTPLCRSRPRRGRTVPRKFSRRRASPVCSSALWTSAAAWDARGTPTMPGRARRGGPASAQLQLTATAGDRHSGRGGCSQGRGRPGRHRGCHTRPGEAGVRVLLRRPRGLGQAFGKRYVRHGGGGGGRRAAEEGLASGRGCRPRTPRSCLNSDYHQFSQ